MDPECLGLDRLFDSEDGGYYMRVNELTYTDPEVVGRVYLLARAVNRLLEQAGIFYWTSGGTTLGIVRLGLTDTAILNLCYHYLNLHHQPVRLCYQYCILASIINLST